MKIKKLAAWTLLMALGMSCLMVMSARATSVVTGKFVGVMMDTRTPRTINTGLTNLRVLRIYVYDPARPAEIAYTTDQLQSDRPGAFLCQTKWLTGLTIVGGTFTASHIMFSRPGISYYWEALGD